MIPVNISDIFIPNGIFGDIPYNKLSDLVCGELNNVGNYRDKTYLMILNELIKVKNTMTKDDKSILLIHNLRNDTNNEIINRTEISFGLHSTNLNYTTVSRSELHH